MSFGGGTAKEVECRRRRLLLCIAFRSLSFSLDRTGASFKSNGSPSFRRC